MDECLLIGITSSGRSDWIAIAGDSGPSSLSLQACSQLALASWHRRSADQWWAWRSPAKPHPHALAVGVA